uniref:Macaca fascicularis brain cDNA, clone: QtrA-16482 n=1 Tax=Macaca fascicularis TaxID=9541 RepID=I7GPH4_MACFA|nr:unnamed protein product [Macaca fascicularis]
MYRIEKHHYYYENTNNNNYWKIGSIHTIMKSGSSKVPKL